MNNQTAASKFSWYGVAGLVLLAPALFWVVGVIRDSNKTQRDRETAVRQLYYVAGRLDAQTSGAGVYIREPNGDLPEKDLWGTNLHVLYSQGGFEEALKVISAGPDKVFGTRDDLEATRSAVNLKGIGTGIKEGVEKTVEGAAKGLVRGVKEGLSKEKK